MDFHCTMDSNQDAFCSEGEELFGRFDVVEDPMWADFEAYISAYKHSIEVDVDGPDKRPKLQQENGMDLFSSSSDLFTTMMTAEELPLASTSGPSEATFRCDSCKRNFKQRKSLLRHLRENKKHRYKPRNQVSAFVCPECGQGCARAYDLERHQQKSCVALQAVRNNTSSQPETEVARYQYTDLSKSFELQCANTNNKIDIPNSRTAQELSNAFAQMSIEWPSRFQNPVKNSRGVNALPCGLCSRRYDVKDAGKFFKHLHDHFEASKRMNECYDCRICFAHVGDLNRHLESAKQKDCGFRFEHGKPCTGHHPPGENGRFEFCFRVRTWEHLSQQLHMSTVSSFAAQSGLGRRSVRTAPHWGWRSSKGGTSTSGKCFSARSERLYSRQMPLGYLTLCDLDLHDMLLAHAALCGNLELMQVAIRAGGRICCKTLTLLWDNEMSDALLSVIIDANPRMNSCPADFYDCTGHCSGDNAGILQCLLYMAFKHESMTLIGFLEQKGARVTCEYLQPAISSTNVELLEFVRARCIVTQPSGINRRIWTSSMKTAVGQKQFSMVGTLLQFKVKDTAQDMLRHMTLCNAIFHKNIGAIRMALEGGADINGQCSSTDCAFPTGHTGLIFAASEHDQDLVDYLIRNGAEPGLQNANGCTALCFALMQPSEDIPLRFVQLSERWSLSDRKSANLQSLKNISAGLGSRCGCRDVLKNIYEKYKSMELLSESGSWIAGVWRTTEGQGLNWTTKMLRTMEEVIGPDDVTSGMCSNTAAMV